MGQATCQARSHQGSSAIRQQSAPADRASGPARYISRSRISSHVARSGPEPIGPEVREVTLDNAKINDLSNGDGGDTAAFGEREAIDGLAVWAVDGGGERAACHIPEVGAAIVGRWRGAAVRAERDAVNATAVWVVAGGNGRAGCHIPEVDAAVGDLAIDGGGGEGAAGWAERDAVDALTVRANPEGNATRGSLRGRSLTGQAALV